MRPCLLLAFSFLFISSSALGQTNNPINGNAPVAFWSLELEDVVTLPSSPRMEDLVGGGEPNMAYVVTQNGPIYRFDTTQQNPTAQLFLDVSSVLGSAFNFSNQTGVRGLAFHPDFNNSGTDGFRKFYTSHSRDAFSGTPAGNPVFFPSPPGVTHDSIIGEWTMNANGTVNTGSYRELMYVGQPETDHNVGQIGFNPAATPGSSDYGKLYIALGDGGGAGDPNDLAQDIDETPVAYPHGSILRIDPIASGSSPYTIPGDNPFAGQSNRIEEIWAYGLRNPHKIGWDSVTGEMYISDIGQGVIEEINIGRQGANYGWDLKEGTFNYVNGGQVSTLPGNHTTDVYTYPVAQYDRNTNGTQAFPGGTAVAGGSVYRGTSVPEITGMYFFADFSTNPNPIFAVDVDDLVERDDFTNVTSLDGGRLAPYVEVEIRDNGTDKTFTEFVDDNNPGSINRTDIRWGLGPDGEIYLLNKRDGVVRKIVGVVGLSEGDANRDGDVDDLDLALLQASFGLAGDWSNGNFDASASVDGSDFLSFYRNFSNTTLAAAQSIPEPSTLISLLLLLSLASSRRGSKITNN